MSKENGIFYDQKKSKILARGSFLTSIFMAYYLYLSLVIEYRVGIICQSIVTVLFLVIPIAAKYKVNIYILGNFFTGLGCTAIMFLTYYSGGFNSPVLPWIALVPIVALLFISRVWAAVWCVISLGFIVFLNDQRNSGHLFIPQYNLKYENVFFVHCTLGLIITYLMLNVIFEYSISRANKQLENKNRQILEKNSLLSEQADKIAKQRDLITLEKQKSDDLLRNILPDEVADELKQNGVSEARYYENVSILFTDFVNFTRISEMMSPQQLVEQLHRCFKEFDAIIAKHNLEKIKTIGDAYMAVSGLPVESENHAINVINAALEIRDFIANDAPLLLHQSSKPGDVHKFNIRIGIHSGPVIAGIVGSTKFAYDIWGDAVNTAARMEQSGQSGEVNISGTTYNLVKNQFNCTHRGKISAKNKGELDMYFVNSINQQNI